jgi:hypothetical protein
MADGHLLYGADGHLLYGASGHLVNDCGTSMFKLTACTGAGWPELSPVYTDTDLEHYMFEGVETNLVGKIVVLSIAPDYCWVVSKESGENPFPVTIAEVYATCTACYGAAMELEPCDNDGCGDCTGGTTIFRRVPSPPTLSTANGYVLRMADGHCYTAKSAATASTRLRWLAQYHMCCECCGNCAAMGGPNTPCCFSPNTTVVYRFWEVAAMGRPPWGYATTYTTGTLSLEDCGSSFVGSYTTRYNPNATSFAYGEGGSVIASGTMGLGIGDTEHCDNHWHATFSVTAPVLLTADGGVLVPLCGCGGGTIEVTRHNQYGEPETMQRVTITVTGNTGCEGDAP